MATYFTADTHFGHGNIIEFCKRPFGSVGEMDEALVAAWNEVVGRRDEVWHLGDFSMGCDRDHAQRMLRRLNGNKHLVVGNHDNIGAQLTGWGSIHTWKDTSASGQRVFLCHYAMRVWPACEIGSINLYGHTHGSIPDTANGCDVGVDCWDYQPVSLDEIRARLAATAGEQP